LPKTGLVIWHQLCLNGFKAALAQGANGRHADLGVQPETVSASFNPLRNAAPQTRRGNDFPAGIAVSPAFFV